MASFASHPFSLRQLQYAVAVADCLSFRKAAEACHVSQPSLSAQLAQFEHVIGVRLFERDRRRVLPTAAGREVIERARRVIVEADNLFESARRAGDPLSGTLRIGVIPTISPYLLPPVSPALRKRYPRLTLLWVEDKTEVLLRKLETGDLDGALLALEADLGAVQHQVIARDDFLLAAPRLHPLVAETSPLRPADLRRADLLLLEEGHCLRDQALAFCTDARVNELEFRATSLSTLVQMVAAGAGVTLLPRLSLPTENRRAELSVRPFRDPAPGRTVALAWRRQSPLETALRQVASTIREAYPQPATPPARARRPRSGRARAAR